MFLQQIADRGPGLPAADLERVSFDEKSFRFEMNEDPMATEKMAEAIRRFTVDTRKLQGIVESKF